MEEASPQPRAVAITRPRIPPNAQPVRQCSVAEIAVRVRSLELSTAHQARDRRHQLLGLLGPVLLVGAQDAMFACSSRSPSATLSSAACTAEIWVRMSMQ